MRKAKTHYSWLWYVGFVLKWVEEGILQLGVKASVFWFLTREVSLLRREPLFFCFIG